MLGSFRLLILPSFLLFFSLSFPIFGKDAPLNFAHIASKISNAPRFEFLDKDAFEKLDLPHEDWSSVTIGNTQIPAPGKTSEILTYLRRVEQALTSCKESTIRFQYGNKEPITLRLPFLGRGNNGAVYEIAGPISEGKRVIKITLPRLQAIESSIIEYESYDFWVNAANNSHTFLVPKQHEAHKLGLYRIMEKNDGITLTKYLLMLGAIHIDNLEEKTASFDAQFLEGLYAASGKQIAQAIQSMISIIKDNPLHCVSLSPNNIHITYHKETLGIKRIDLVDIGPVPSKLSSYQKLDTFYQFLELCSERLQKYISIPEYQYDVGELQKYQSLYKGPKRSWVRKNQAKQNSYHIND